MPGLDAAAIAKRFPALHRTQRGRTVVFADAPGGTQVPASVIDAMAAYLSDSNANEGGAFATSRETGAVVAAARAAAADLLGCAATEVVFGPNMTTLAFALSRSLARDLGPGDEVVVTRLDHDANIAPWVAAAEDSGATVRWVDITTPDCSLDMASLEAALGDSTRLVAFPLASNAVGTIPDASEVVRLARRTNALVVADAVHLAPHQLIDARLGVDFLFCSPYKFFGPHMGVMYGRKHLLDELSPYKVRPSSDESPARWETGTKNHEALAGLCACVDYLAELGDAQGDRRSRLENAFTTIATHERGLTTRFLAGLEHLPGVELFGISDPGDVALRTPTFALRFTGMSPRDAATKLGARGIFTWDGNYYALAVMQRLGLEESGGALRIGFCHYHSAEDVDRVLEALGELP
ncbi:MAG: cysteine desulfurase-like protein [Actinomycetota bacterium]